MSLRELRVLVTHLPPESATVRALHGHNWRDLEYMVAELLDVVKYHRVEWAAAHGARPSRPKPTARPKAPTVERQQVTERELARAAHQHVLDQVGLSTVDAVADETEEV